MRYILILLLALTIMLFGCSRTQTLSDVLNDEHVGKEITVSGSIAQSKLVRCTMQFCTEENPCCQTCSADLILADEDASVTLKGENIGCKGNNCEMTCSPEAGSSYSVTGTLEKEGEKYLLNAENYEK